MVKWLRERLDSWRKKYGEGGGNKGEDEEKPKVVSIIEIARGFGAPVLACNKEYEYEDILGNELDGIRNFYLSRPYLRNIFGVYWEAILIMGRIARKYFNSTIRGLKRQDAIWLRDYGWDCLGKKGVGAILGLRVKPAVLAKYLARDEEPPDVPMYAKVSSKLIMWGYVPLVTSVYVGEEGSLNVIAKFSAVPLHLPNNPITDVRVDKKVFEPIGFFFEPPF